MATKIPLNYKGRPLYRKDNVIYYGNMSDPYIIMMQIVDTESVKDLTVASRVSIQLQHTNGHSKNRDTIVKRSEKDSLYSAMDIATVWLDRAMAAR